MRRRFSFVVVFLAAVLLAAPSVAERMAYDDSGKPVQALEMGTVQTVAYTGAAAATTNAVAGSGTTVVRIVCTTDCHFVAAASPTATTSSSYLPANTVEYISVQATDKLSFIQVSASGTAYVTATK